MKTKNLNQNGFTIVELIVSIVVSGILIGAVHVIHLSHTYLSQRTRDLVLANSFAEHKVEALRSAGLLGLSNGTTNITSELPSELNTPRSGSLVISDQNSAVKKILLTISYNDQGTTKTYSYITYIGELGVGQY